MHYVHHHCDTHPVGFVHQSLELVRSPETRTHGEEVGDLVTKGTIVRMLLESHYLDGVISKLLDPRKHILAEIIERSDLPLLRAHPDMALVDQRMRPPEHLVMFPWIWFRRVPDLGTENLRDRILHESLAICRDTLASAARPFDEQLVQFPVAQEHRIQPEFPVPLPGYLELVGTRAFPVVEFTDQVYLRRVRRPFPDHPGPVRLLVETIVEMVVDTAHESIRIRS